MPHQDTCSAKIAQKKPPSRWVATSIHERVHGRHVAREWLQTVNLPFGNPFPMAKKSPSVTSCGE